MAKNQKHETTIIFNAEVTIIKEGDFSETIPAAVAEEDIRRLEKLIKKEFGLDDLHITDLKLFCN